MVKMISLILRIADERVLQLWNYRVLVLLLGLLIIHSLLCLSGVQSPLLQLGDQFPVDHWVLRRRVLNNLLLNRIKLVHDVSSLVRNFLLQLTWRYNLFFFTNILVFILLHWLLLQLHLECISRVMGLSDGRLAGGAWGPVAGINIILIFFLNAVLNSWSFVFFIIDIFSFNLNWVYFPSGRVNGLLSFLWR